MESAAGVAAAHGVSLPMHSSQASRQKWLPVVPDHSIRNAGSEDSERSNSGQSDERTIYEQGREPADVDFCSVTIDGSSNSEILQQQQQNLHNVVRQREELQQVEIELRAGIIARSEIMEMQNKIMDMQSRFDAQIKEHTNANVKLQEKIHEMDQMIHEQERKMEEKDRELHAIKLDNEAAWAKEDLLREQSKELQSFRRERDNSEAERAQHLNQIRDFQEHIQEKENQFLELQEQHRVAQETILFKDEQLREAQAWIARAQEMDAILQAELRERTEQYNQLWLGCQRQFADMDRIHLHTVQHLQLELAEAREKGGSYHDESHLSHTNSKGASQFGLNNGNQLDVNGSVTGSENSGAIPNGNAENVGTFGSTGNASTQADHVHGVPIAPSSLLGLPTYLPPGQVTALHPFVMHQQGVAHSVPSHVGHFHSVPALSSLQHWQNQQASSESSQVPTNNQYHPSQTDQNLLRSEYGVSVNGQAITSDYLDVNVSHGIEPDAVIPSSAVEGQVLEQDPKSYLVAPQPQQSLQHISSQFHEALRLDPLSQNCEIKEKIDHGLEGIEFTTEHANTPNGALSSETPINHVNFTESTLSNSTGAVSSEAFVSSGQTNIHTGGKASEIALLDERSLLACIVRTIPPGSGGRIRISSTLPNRLGKMLLPLHWHDYKKKYGKLDDFVAGHPELFVIEGDSIQLREGAQEIIAATAAVAKVAAAAKIASSPYSSLLPSVAVTPVAQPHRLKRGPSIDSNSVKSDMTGFKEHAAAFTPASGTDNSSQLSVGNQHSNGVFCLNAGGIPNIKLLSKPKDLLELSSTESRPAQSSGLLAVGNGANSDRPVSGSSLTKGSTHGRPSANFVGKQLDGRTTAVTSTSRR